MSESRKIPVADIWKWHHDCWKCGKTIPVVWPQPGHLDNDVIGGKLSELHLGNVEKVYSNTLSRKVWGNVCSSCGAYSGNHFVAEEQLSMIAARQSTKAPVENGHVKILAEIPIEQHCENCNRVIEKIRDSKKCNICDSSTS